MLRQQQPGAPATIATITTLVAATAWQPVCADHAADRRAREQLREQVEAQQQILQSTNAHLRESNERYEQLQRDLDKTRQDLESQQYRQIRSLY